jgi:hypothetical protein
MGLELIKILGPGSSQRSQEEVRVEMIGIVQLDLLVALSLLLMVMALVGAQLHHGQLD